MFRRGAVYYLHVPTPDGRHVQKSTGTTQKTLAGRMHRMVRDLRDGRDWTALGLVTSGAVSLGTLYDAFAAHRLPAFVREQSSPAWADLVDAWLRTLDVRPSTRVMYEMQVRAVLPDGARVTGITTGAIRDGLAALEVKPATARNYLAAVQSFVGYLVAHDLLPSDPTADARKLPRPKKGKPRTTWMTRAEDARLCLAAPSPLRQYFALVHGTGAERNAALAMTRADVDMERAEVRIPGTKTDTRDRRGIPVDAWAWAILKPYVRGVLSGPLFPTLSKWTVNQAHVEARTAAGLDGYQLRDARHSVAVRWLVQDGVPMWEVAERLGHADMSMAVKVYTKTVLRDAAKRLGVDDTTQQKLGKA
jgi:integrase